MAYGNEASFGGVPLADAQDVSWDLTSGPAAPWKTFVVHEKHWEAIRSRFGVPQTLTITRAHGATVRVRALYALRELPSQKPFHRAFMVSDERWKWPYRLYVRAMNAVVRTGKTYVVPDVGPVEIAQNAEEVTYAPWSLDPEGKKPWTAKRALEDVMKAVTGNAFRIESLPIQEGQVLRSVSVQNVEWQDRGDAAVRRALTLLPGCDVRMDGSTAVVYDSTKIAQSRGAVRSVKETTEGNIARFVNLASLRPSKIRVFFEREVEIRFDAEEEGREGETTDYHEAKAGQGWAHIPQMRMRNVLVSPDVPALEIDGEKFAAGSYVVIRDAIEKWSEDLSAVENAPELTQENLRKLWFVLDSLYVPLGDLSADADQANWASRISSLREHYRQTWRIDRTWMHHIRDLRPWRVGVIDPVHLVRGKAMAWSEHCKVPTTKYRVVKRNSKDKAFFWLNVEGYPGYDEPLDDKAAAPAAVHVLDSTAGIVRIDYSPGPYGLWAMIHPSCMRTAGGSGDLVAPTLDLSKRDGVFAPQVRTSSATPMGFSDRFGAAVILTAIPGAPNGKERCHVEDVDAGELQGLLSPDFRVTGGDGPELELYVPAGIMTAWYAWSKTSEARQSARHLFGLTPASIRSSAPGYEVLNKDMLKAVAKAFAAVYMSQWVDAWEGAQAGTLTPGVVPVGNVAGVTHRLQPDGRATTTIHMPPNRAVPDWMALIPEPLRHAILGTISQGKQ